MDDEQVSSILSTKEENITNDTIVNDKFEYESDTNWINLKRKDAEVFRNSKFFRCIIVDSSTSKCLKEIECDEEKAEIIVSLCKTSPNKDDDMKEREGKSDDEGKREEGNNRNRYILEQKEVGSQIALQEDFMAVAMLSDTTANHRSASDMSGDFKRGNMDASKFPREITIDQEGGSSRDDNDDRRDSIETNSSSGSSNSGFLVEKIKRINRTMRNKK